MIRAPGFLRSRCRSVLCDPLGMVLGARWAPYMLSDSFPLFPQEQNIPPSVTQHHAGSRVASTTPRAPCQTQPGPHPWASAP